MAEYDLSAGVLSDSEVARADYRLKLDKQKLRHRSVAFWTVLLCGVALIACFVCFELRVMGAVESAMSNDKALMFPWSLFALGSAMLAGGVTLLFGIVRFTYRQEGAADDKEDAFPPAETVGKVAELVKAITGKGQE